MRCIPLSLSRPFHALLATEPRSASGLASPSEFDYDLSLPEIFGHVMTGPEAWIRSGHAGPVADRSMFTLVVMAFTAHGSQS